MPIPTAQCAICGQAVTKRSTLALSSLGLGDGRACRSHEEVGKALAAKEKMDKDAKLWAQAESNLRIISGVSTVRVMRSFFGWPLEVIYFRIQGGLTKQEMVEVRRQVQEQGPEMSSDEMFATTVMATEVLTAKVREKHGI